MTGRQLLDAVGQAVAETRRLRDASADTFDDVDVHDLERAARGLRLVAADCSAGAQLLDRAIAARSTEP